MERVLLTISDNGLEAIVRIEPGPEAAPEDLPQAVAEAGVVHGIDTAVLRELSRQMTDSTFSHGGVIARGRAAEPGHDGRLEFAFSIGVEPGRQAADGSVDWRERGFLHGFSEGDEVARYVAPTPGRSGRTVRGEEVPATPGRDTLPGLGKGVALEPDGRVLATRDGVLRYAPDNLLDVVPLYVHEGDVDLHTGNLHARGSVQVRGDVHEDMIVEASDDVEIRGSVLGGSVRAGGTVVVRQAVQGEGSSVRAGRDLTCRHATSAELVAGGTIRVQDHVMHSRLAADTVTVDRGRGAVVGGEIRACKKITVREAGSGNGAPTLLAAAEPLPTEDAAPRGARGPAPGDRRRQRELQRLRAKLLPEAEIRVRRTAHAGVRIQFGSTEIELPDSVREVRFTCSPDEGAIRMETGAGGR